MELNIPQQLPTSYEMALQELEMRLGQLEDGFCSVDQLPLLTDRIATLISFCKERLKQVETQTEKTLKDL